MKIQITAILILTLAYSIVFAFGGKSDKISREELQSAPESVNISGQEITMDTYLWRDFMPNSPKDGKPLKASIKIKTANGEKISTNFSADKIWILKDNDLWIEKLEGVGRKLPPKDLTMYELIASDGPKWQPGTTVTVVVRIILENGNKLLLKKTDQKIEKTQ